MYDLNFIDDFHKISIALLCLMIINEEGIRVNVPLI